MIASVVSICTGASLGALVRWVLAGRFNAVFPALPLGTPGTAYGLTAAQLLAGFTDIDGGTLAVTDLVADPKVVCTPHIGAQTVEAQARAAEDIASEVLAALRGETLRWRV